MSGVPEMSDEELGKINPAWVAERAAFKAGQGAAETDADLGPTLTAARDAFKDPVAWPVPLPSAARHPQVHAMIADIARAEVDRAHEAGELAPAAAYMYAHEASDAAIEREAEAARVAAGREALPVGWTRDADETAFTTALAAQVGTAPAEIVHIIDEGHRAARRAEYEGPVNPEATMAALRLRFGDETDSKIAKAQRLVAQAPPRVIAWLEATGQGNNPLLIGRVIEWAEARERRGV